MQQAKKQQPSEEQEKEVEVEEEKRKKKKEEREDRVRLAEDTGRSDGNSTLSETIPRGRNV